MHARGVNGSSPNCHTLIRTERHRAAPAGKAWRGAALLLAAVLLTVAPLLAGCGGEAVPEYRERVREILSKLESPGLEEGPENPGGKANPSGHDNAAGHESGNPVTVDPGSLERAIAELEEVRVPPGWEEFHRSLIRALSSLAPESHAGTHATEENAEEVPLEEGDGGEAQTFTPHQEEEPEKATTSPTGVQEHGHPASPGGH